MVGARDTNELYMVFSLTIVTEGKKNLPSQLVLWMVVILSKNVII